MELEGLSTELEGTSMELAGSSTELEELSTGFGPQETKANKAKAVYGLVKGEVTENVPASVLQLHNNCVLVCDEAAASLIR